MSLQTPPSQSRSLAWSGALLLLLVCLAYLPALRGGFIWDDDRYVTANPMLTAPDGLKQIWFSAHRQSQYFPLVYTTLRFEHLLWGVNPMGYHAVNILLHGVNALLVWLVLRKLAVPGAWLAAALFALHPVQVESVAWITELKNTQSTLFALLALLAWMRFAEPGSARRWRFYGLALLLYQLGLFSKTTVCTLPAALVLVLWWRKQPIGWRTALPILPFLFLAGAMGLVSVWWERHLGSYDPQYALSFSFLERGLIAARALWFYALKLLWPLHLTFSYPRWAINPRDPLQSLWVLGCLAVAGLLWRQRRAWGRGPAAAVAFFVATLSPLVGFISLYTFRYSFVADHYQYVACIGLFALVAAGLSHRRLTQRLSPPLHRGLCGLLLLVLGTLTWQQASAYRDDETLWRDTAAKNPQSWMAFNYLGFYAEQRGALPEAVTYFRKSIELHPNSEAINNLGKLLASQGQADEAIRHFQKAIELDPRSPAPYENLGTALAAQGRIEAAIAQYQKVLQLYPGRAQAYCCLAAALQQADRAREAVAQYRAALRCNPALPEALKNLASILASDASPELRDGREAVRLAKQACEVTHYRDDYALSVLGMAYAEAGRFEEALAMVQQAEQLAKAAGDQEGVNANRKLAELFRARQPYHDSYGKSTER
ncbi:MAG TPA: tetratricopeptide repeat protein [Bacillota bacterium]|nr:tetratricopeptide repeat protein [Bacillota bacterium]